MKDCSTLKETKRDEVTKLKMYLLIIGQKNDRKQLENVNSLSNAYKNFINASFLSVITELW